MSQNYNSFSQQLRDIQMFIISTILKIDPARDQAQFRALKLCAHSSNQFTRILLTSISKTLMSIQTLGIISRK